ncbi:MAG TPA: hypothetical protein PKA55_08865 [Rhodoblastus sp.]|nr:hypothetical protein [Rhodoblastus sp.]
MNVGSAAPASQTIFTRARRAHCAMKSAAAVATPVAARTISSAASGAPAAPAAPNLGPLPFARKLGVMNS